MNEIEIKNKIKESDEFSIGCLIALFRMQEADEKNGNYTAHKNDVGFNAFDAGVMTSIAKYYIDKGFLSPNQIKLIKSKLPKYYKQLTASKIIEFPNNTSQNPQKVKGELKGPFIVPCNGKDRGLFMKASLGDMFKIDSAEAMKKINELKKKMTNRRFIQEGPVKYWKVAQTVFNYDCLVELKFKPDDELVKWREEQVSIDEADDDIVIPKIKAELYPFQKKAVSFVDARDGRALIADDMGCIDGEAVLTVYRNGTKKRVKLSDFYWIFHIYDKTKTLSLKDDSIELNNIKRVIHKGKKETIKIETEKGRSLKLTPDHIIFTPNGEIEAGNLKIGDYVLGVSKSVENDIITEISNSGIIDVYDIVMEDPYRNFVINDLIVHNCGKTLESLAWTEYRGNTAFPLLIICPANLKRNWYREIHKFIDDPSVEIVGGRKPYRNLEEFGTEIYTMIINYDVINNWENFIVNEFCPNTIIIDEGHYIKNEKTKRYRSVEKITKGVDHLMILTGTPIESRLEDSYPMIHLISPAMFPNKKSLVYKYVEKKMNEKGYFVTVGLKNAEELHKILTTEIMIRRLKEDVLHDLPPKQTSIIPCELNNKREYAVAEEDFLEWLRNIDEGRAKRAANAEAITRINYLKQLAAKGKLEDVYKFIDSFLDQDDEEKLIIFCMHHEIMNAVFEKYSDISMTFHGKMNAKQKELAEQNFKDDPNKRLFIMQLESGGVGLNLVESSTVLHIEFPWNFSKLSQATDRIHRIGQMKPVNEYMFTTENTIEDKLISILDIKRTISEAVIDGKPQEEIQLLSKLIKLYKKEEKNAKRKRRNTPHRRTNRVS